MRQFWRSITNDDIYSDFAHFNSPHFVSMTVWNTNDDSLKSEMLSLARTSKYVTNTSVLSINKSEEDS